jgi:hypothetical protein
MKLLTALIAVYLSTALACAHDHNHPELQGWFAGLQSGRGMTKPILPIFIDRGAPFRRKA